MRYSRERAIIISLNAYFPKELPMTMRKIYCCLPILLVAFLFVVTDVAAADPASAAPTRPRIGLVLGGGGARGAAHIGVLRELERLRVPVDAIAGTSMGAIVGGLYATGMSANELEELVATLDWADAFSDAPRRQDLRFRRKQDDEQYPIGLELGVRDGDLLLPKGVLQGQKLGLVLRDLTRDVAHITDFDELPIPFRAIGSDIESGDAHVMAGGDLARAIRASMSVPGLIAPARVDGRLLVDGGLVANLPIDVMRTMGVDIIIAVDVEFPLYSSEELESVVTITEQMLTLLIRKETLRQIESLAENDILIRPQLGTFASSNFANIVDAIEPGVDATRGAQEHLSAFSLDEQAYANFQSRRTRPQAHPDRLAFVNVVHDGRLASELLVSRLGISAGDPIDTRELAAGANRLYRFDLYEQVSYELVSEDGETGVEYQARSKSWGPNILKFGVSVADNFDGSTAFNLSARLTKAGLNKKGAEWRNDFQLGTDPQLLSEFYQPFGADSRYFFAPRIDLRQSNSNAYVMGDTVARLRVSSAETGMDIGAELGSFGELRIGVFHGTGEARVKVGDPTLSNVDFDTGGVFGQLRFDTLDNARFPRHGVRAGLRWTLSRPGLGADESFDTFDSEFIAVWSRGKSSLQFGLDYATTISSNSSLQDFFPLGGFLSLSGLERGNISGPHAGVAKLVYYRRVGDSAGGLFEVPTYLGVSAEAGNVWQSRADLSFDTLLLNGSVFAGFDTYLGAIYLAAGFGEGGEANYYLSIGSPPR